MCGEKPNRWPWTATLPGSPPRVRGKEYSRAPTYQPYGITPACAGKRKACVPLMSRDRDHPRVCGEKLGRLWQAAHNTGSPPRVRGKGVGAPHFACDLGITPACAGKSQTGFALGCRVGITPACAGKSGFSGVSASFRRDHPRVCGEKSRRSTTSKRSKGSPPRVRGKAADHPSAGVPVGITPACAGKRLKRSHRIGHFSCILCLFHSVLHRASVSGGSRAGPCAPPCLPAQNAVPV